MPETLSVASRAKNITLVFHTQKVMFDNLQPDELYFGVECRHIGNTEYVAFSKQLSCAGS